MLFLPNNPFYYNNDVFRNIKAQANFIQSAKRKCNSLNLSIDYLVLSSPPYSLDFLNINIKLDLFQRVVKSEMCDAPLRSFAMEIIEVLYPENDWLCIFTDGSMLVRTCSTGANIHCELFNFYLPTRPRTTAFDGEIEAIVVAVQ